MVIMLAVDSLAQVASCSSSKIAHVSFLDLTFFMLSLRSKVDRDKPQKEPVGMKRETADLVFAILQGKIETLLAQAEPEMLGEEDSTMPHVHAIADTRPGLAIPTSHPSLGMVFLTGAAQPSPANKLTKKEMDQTETYFVSSSA